MRRVFLLIDSRTGIKPVDEDIMKELDSAAVPYQIVLTKTDKVSFQDLQKVMKDVSCSLEKHAAAHNTVLQTSSEKKIGLDEVRAEIADFMI